MAIPKFMVKRSNRESHASENRWREAIHQKNHSEAPLFTLYGPSGAGKTSAISALAAKYPVFVEATDGNPHLEALLKGKDYFDAARNQEWFLERIGKYISNADRNMPLILDQDPAAIVLAYGKMFFDEGRIKKAEYESLLEKLLKIEAKLQNWRCPRYILYLDASAEVLHQRVMRRAGELLTPPIEWFVQIRERFISLSKYFPKTVKLSTEDLLPAEVVSRAESIVKNLVKPV